MNKQFSYSNEVLEHLKKKSISNLYAEELHKTQKTTQKNN